MSAVLRFVLGSLAAIAVVVVGSHKLRHSAGTPVSSPQGGSGVTLAELWRRGQVGWPRRFAIAQFPNPPLLLALAGWGFAAVAGGTANDVGRAVFIVGLGVWAWEEAVGGVNWFRRLLGVVAFVWIVAAVAGEL